MDTPTHRQFRFSIREMFLFVLVVALAVAWWLEHSRLIQLQNSAKNAPRYVSKLTRGAAKVGKSKEDIRAALGVPHDESVIQGVTYWLYHFDEEPSHRLSIQWDANDRVEAVRDIH